MKTLKTALFIATLIGAPAIFAATSADGTPVADSEKITRQVTITPQTQYINVRHGDTLRFALNDGTLFNWKFDGLSNYVNLSDIAPKGTINQDTKIYVGSRPKQR